MQLSGSGATDSRWLEKICDSPPQDLKQLEHWFGSLDVDFAGTEGMGSVFRRIPGLPVRGYLRPEVKQLQAQFLWDFHHQHPQVPRNMSLKNFYAVIDSDFGRGQAIFEQKYGAGRMFDTEHKRLTEYGQWFYLHAQPNQDLTVEWHRTRPEFAIPAAPAGSREQLMNVLMDCLVVGKSVDAIVAAIRPLAPMANAAVGGDLSRLDLSFRPGLPIELVATTFGWNHPVAWSGDVHMSRWHLTQRYDDRQAKIGVFCVDVVLDGWPRGHSSQAPRLGKAGASALYDASAIANVVFSISVYKKDGD
jgi:hypothetical protein